MADGSGKSAPPTISAPETPNVEIPILPEFVEQDMSTMISGFDTDAVNKIQPVLVVNDLQETQSKNQIRIQESTF